MNIIALTDSESIIFSQAVAMLTAEFPLSADWQTLEGATEELESILEDGVLFAAIEGDMLLGYVGALRGYDFAWELHPLVVGKTHQRRGIGRLLVARLEEEARQEGILTIMLGTDDEDFRTSLSQVDDLFTDLWQHIATIHQIDSQNPHPYEFYQKCGYHIVGVVPDANGHRKPDIFMAKRL